MFLCLVFFSSLLRIFFRLRSLLVAGFSASIKTSSSSFSLSDVKISTTSCSALHFLALTYHNMNDPNLGTFSIEGTLFRWKSTRQRGRCAQSSWRPFSPNEAPWFCLQFRALLSCNLGSGPLNILCVENFDTIIKHRLWKTDHFIEWGRGFGINACRT